MKHPRLKAILIYMGILSLIILAMIINNLENYQVIGPETGDLFTCTGRKGIQWNCDFWTFFRRNIFGDIFFTGIFMPHYALIFLVLSVLSIFRLEKFLKTISKKKLKAFWGHQTIAFQFVHFSCKIKASDF